jgi:hypothetical protein
MDLQEFLKCFFIEGERKMRVKMQGEFGKIGIEQDILQK